MASIKYTPSGTYQLCIKNKLLPKIVKMDARGIVLSGYEINVIDNEAVQHVNEAVQHVQVWLVYPVPAVPG